MNDRDELHARQAKMRRGTAARATAWLLALSSVACAGSLADPSEFQSSATGPGGSSSGAGAAPCTTIPDVPSFLNMTCGFAGCHTSAMGQIAAGGVDLSLAGQGKLSTQMSNDVPGDTIISPGNPMKSALYAKLQPNAPGANGQMPSGGLDAASIVCIGQWITSL